MPERTPTRNRKSLYHSWDPRVSPTARMQGFSTYVYPESYSRLTDNPRYGTLCPARARGHHFRQQARRQACPRLSCTQSRSRHTDCPLRNALPYLVHHLPQTHHHRPRRPLQRREEKSGKLSYYANFQLPHEACGMWGFG